MVVDALGVVEGAESAAVPPPSVDTSWGGPSSLQLAHSWIESLPVRILEPANI